MTSQRLTRDSLVASFHDADRPREEWLVGAEFERHLLQSDGTPLPYFGEPGVGWLLQRLTRYGWEPVYEGEHVIAMSRGAASVTLEPGSQFELSGTAGGALQAVDDEARQFTREVDAELQGTGVSQIALGYTPFARVPDIEWAPKGRYGVMRRHLGETGALAHHMMKGTCAVQASFDWSSEADCGRKVRVASLLGPLTTAMFANSPWEAGRPAGFMSFRGHIWTQTDPRRTGFPAATEDFSFEAWVDWLLQMPMMFVKDAEGRWVYAKGRTFSDWMNDPSDPPSLADWELHTTSVFPEVRIKRTIEVRGADCVPLPLAMGFVSLFKGLFYCDIATDYAIELGERFARHGTSTERFAVACRYGLEGEVGGRRLADWTTELVEAADAALQRCAPEDRPWLRPLIAQAATGVSPARTLLDRVGETPDPATVLAATNVIE